MASTNSTTFQQAARELRRLMRKSQQAMATHLGVSMAALRNYESGAVPWPDARPAVAYLLAANDLERRDLVLVFRSALYQAMGIRQHQTPDPAQMQVLRQAMGLEAGC